jgi:hypothetical protein
MLGYLLAVLVGTGSVGLYVAAFFFPEIHRKPDFIWGGVGLFYALALWIYAKEISGGILVGQAASVALLGWFGWQTIRLRQLVPIDWQTAQPISKKPERSTPKPTTSPAPKDSQPPSKKASTHAAAAPTSERNVPPAPPANKSAPKHSVDRAASSPKSALQPASSTPVAKVQPDPTPAPPPPAKVDAPQQNEPDEQAWIRLEVKPAPDSASRSQDVARSTPPAQPQPQPENIHPSPPPRQPAPPPAPVSTQPTPVIQPPPPPAKSPAVSQPTVPTAKPELDKEVITISFPSPATPPAQQPIKSPPSPSEPTASAIPPAPPSPSTAKSIQEPPLEQTGDLDKLIAELDEI